MIFAVDPRPIRLPLEHALSELRTRRFSEALWGRRLDAWTSDPQVQKKIAMRLGWLDAPSIMRPHVPRLQTLAAAVKADGFMDVVLLGMGGSSLAPEVIRAVIGVAPGFPRFHVLDSIDPDEIRLTIRRPETTLFIVASKSGSTIEVSSLAAEAERLVRESGVVSTSSHFIAITDEGSPLHQQALNRKFRDLFLNPADIGGRYSALSFFGLVPAALMGVDITALLASADAMAALSRNDDPQQNPAVMLGAAMAAGALAGRDKLTLRLPATLEPLALWVEQLVAESTGKNGKGIVPVLAPRDDSSGQDRLDVSVDSVHDAALGGAFFQWEIATAAAGFLLGINPFDEPNVQQAKDATRALLAGFQSDGQLPIPTPHASFDGVDVTFSAAARERMRHGGPAEFASLLQPGDYCGLLAYLPSRDARFAEVLYQAQSAVTARSGCVTTIGYGPRYLHSTGQLHKGGPNTGLFIVVTTPSDSDRPIPGESYSFGILEQAQGLGDFQSLDRERRRAAYVHLPKRDPSLLSATFRRFFGD